MNSGTKLLRWAGGIMIALGAGHLTILTFTAWEDVAGWVEQGVWAAVPLSPGSVDTVPGLENKLAFWGGPGSFAAPMALLGYLIRHLAGRGVTVPAGIGWGVAIWCALGGVLLVPSPFLAGVVPGLLIVLAARKKEARKDGTTVNAGTAREGSR
ncbi:DUF6463 family protein [Streptomyces sp. NPDC046324]|uniref:DUF6463 family protein n=1 Tax=Streptomyces sp. NPDC046324 TaxID=3154915 RepID=UPI0033DD75A1